MDDLTTIPSVDQLASDPPKKGDSWDEAAARLTVNSWLKQNGQAELAPDQPIPEHIARNLGKPQRPWRERLLGGLAHAGRTAKRALFGEEDQMGALEAFGTGLGKGAEMFVRAGTDVATELAALPLEREAGDRIRAASREMQDEVWGGPLNTWEGLAKNVTQAFMGFGIASKLPGLGGKVNLAKGLVQGAFVDAATFSPYEEQLAEMMRDQNLQGFVGDRLRDLGDLLSVDQEDDVVDARLKRVLGGAVPSVPFSLPLLAVGLHGMLRNARRLATAGNKDVPVIMEALGRYQSLLKEAEEGGPFFRVQTDEVDGLAKVMPVLDPEVPSRNFAEVPYAGDLVDTIRPEGVKPVGVRADLSNADEVRSAMNAAAGGNPLDSPESWVRSISVIAKDRVTQEIDAPLFSLKRAKRLFDRLGVKDRQIATSAETSINSSKLPAVFSKAEFQSGTVNLDLGGGRFDNATEALRERGVENLIFDPFNRDADHNAAILDALDARGGAETVTVSNVLNVIDSDAAQRQVLEQARAAVKPGGRVYISVYEGNGSGAAGPSSAGFQRNLKTSGYLPMVEEVMPGAKLKKGMIVWERPLKDATEVGGAIAPPGVALAYHKNPDRMVQYLRHSSPEMLDMAEKGLQHTKTNLALWQSGTAKETDTGLLFAWTTLSIQASPMAQEAGFIEIMGSLAPFLDDAAKGTFNLSKFRKAMAAHTEVLNHPIRGGASGNVMRSAKKAGDKPTASLELFLTWASKKNGGKTNLSRLHDLMKSDKSGREIRREFWKLIDASESVGLDNKLVSFALLVSGRDDVLILDRQQLSHLWGVAAGSTEGLMGKFGGRRGALLYEHLEDGLRPSIEQAYAKLGRPASMGRFHWESWLVTGQQAAGHPSLEAITRHAGGKNAAEAISGIRVPEGKLDTFKSGFQFELRDGQRVMHYPMRDGSTVEMTLGESQAFAEVLAKAASQKSINTALGGIFDGKFKVTAVEGGRPWYERAGVNRDAVEGLARRIAGSGAETLGDVLPQARLGGLAGRGGEVTGAVIGGTLGATSDAVAQDEVDPDALGPVYRDEPESRIGTIIKALAGAAAGAALFKGADALINRGLADELSTAAATPKYLTREAAEKEAALLNKVAEGATHANVQGKLSQDQLEQVLWTARKMRENPDKIDEILAETRWGISFATSTENLRSIHAALVAELSSAFEKASPHIPMKVSIDRALQRMGGLTAESAKAVFPELAGKTQNLHVETLVANSILRDMGEQLADLSRQIDLSPQSRDDLLEIARPLLETYFSSALSFSGVKSDLGRALVSLQWLSNARLTQGAARKGNVMARGAAGAIIGGIGAPAVAEAQAEEGQEPRTGTKLALGVGGAIAGAAAFAGARGVAAREVPRMAAQASIFQKGMTVAGMSTRDLEKVLRLFSLAGGQPRNIVSIAKAANAAVKSSNWDRGMEVFYNSMLSAPVTWGTVAVSGITTLAFETSARALAGLSRIVTHRDPRDFREAADLMVGYVSYLRENLKSASIALSEGRSVINPTPMQKHIPGAVGEAVRTPGRIMTALDEFSRVTAYRAYIRAKSLREGREAVLAKGLVGKAATYYLAQRVEADLAMAFDGPTGIGLVEDALKLGDLAAFTTPLDKSGPSSWISEGAQKFPALRLFVPFVRSVANINRYAFLESTPLGIGLSPKVRQVLRTPGEGRRVMLARMTLGSTLGSMALWKVMGGEMTGGGPKDPKLRALWEKDHQPYSVKVNVPGAGPTWVSYKRLDPFASIIGVMADLGETYEYWGKDVADETVEEVVAALVGAFAENFAAKGYATGFSTLVGAMNNDEKSVLKLWQGPVSTVVPRAVTAFNDDPYIRSVRTTVDRIRSRTPGFSENLPPSLDIFGEWRKKSTDPLWSTWSPIPTREATIDNVESALLQLGRGFSPPSRVLRTRIGRSIRIDTREWVHKDGRDIAPYERWGELIVESGVRNKVIKFVNSDEWRDLGDGIDSIRGGPRWDKVNTMLQVAYDAAWQKVLREFPDLAEASKAARALYNMDRSGTVKERADTLFDNLLPSKRRQLQ